jgi:subtilase family serine protease
LLEFTMFFPKRPRSLRTHATKAVNQKRHSRRRNRPIPGQIPRAVCCGPTVEELEGRQMLSAAPPTALVAAAPHLSFVAKPTFVLLSQVAPGAQPDTVAPITPQQMQTAYGVNQIAFNGITGDGTGQTVAIVDAYNAPNIISDTASFNTFYHLQPFNAPGGPTLQVLGQDGTTTLPTGNNVDGWDVEESLDVQWVHAIAPQANIILYEANSSGGGDLYATELSAAANPAVTVVSNSWGAGEYPQETQDEAAFFLTPVKHQGVTFLASTGDDGTPAGFPAYSRDVVAVGGTTLQVQTNGTYISESGWSGSGGGISQFEPLPPYQSGLNGSNGASTVFRNAPDVAADADPSTGVLVFDTTLPGGNEQVGGTSLACPLWAGMIAIADQGRALDGLG